MVRLCLFHIRCHQLAYQKQGITITLIICLLLCVNVRLSNHLTSDMAKVNEINISLAYFLNKQTNQKHEKMQTNHFIVLCSVFSDFPSQKYEEVNLKQISYIFMYFCFILTAFSHCGCQQIPFKQE